MFKTSNSALVGASILASAGAAMTGHAHHPGGAGSTGGAGPINTISAVTLGEGQTTVGFLFEYTVLNTMSDATLAYDASKHQHVHSLSAIASPAVSMAYGISNDLTVSARLPYVTRSDIREGTHAHIAGVSVNSATARGGASGIGDASALGQYRFVNNRETGTQWALLAGIKAPTGRTGLKDKNGEIFEAEFSPGNGSWDWSAGLALSQQYGRAALHANVLHTWVGRSAWDEIEPTRLGNRFQYNLAATYRWIGAVAGAPGATFTHTHADGTKHTHVAAPTVSSGPSLDVMLEMNGEIHEHQKVAGVIDRHSGGHTLYLAPGLRLSMDKWSAFASVGVPMINDQTGNQAEPSVRVVTGIAVSF
jgi:hypothetical protein